MTLSKDEKWAVLLAIVAVAFWFIYEEAVPIGLTIFFVAVVGFVAAAALGLIALLV